MNEPEKYFTNDIMDGLQVAAHKEFTYGGSDELENDSVVEVTSAEEK